MVLFQILPNQPNYTEGEVMIIIKVLLWITITYSVDSISNVVMFALSATTILYTRGTCLSGKNR